MKSFAVFSLVLVMSGFAHAKDLDGIDCDNAMSQYEMNMCAGESADKADATLNKTYKQLKALIGNDRPAVQKLIKAERAWIVYRDTHCEDETKDSVGGSIHSLELSGCKEEKTEARTQELKKMIAKRQNR